MRIRLTFLTILLVNIASGQSINKLGIRIGINSTYQSISNKEVGSVRAYSSAEIGSKSKSLQGFNFGVVSILKITESINFRPGIIYSEKGQIEYIEEDFQGGGFSYEDHINYLELPLLFSFTLSKAKNNSVFLSGGVYTAYGIGGKSKFSYPYNNGQVENGDIEFVSSIEQRDSSTPYNLLVKRMDFGLKTGIGYRFGNAIFEINYDIGLLNINPKISQPRQNSNDVEWNDRVKRNMLIAFSFEYFIFSF